MNGRRRQRAEILLAGVVAGLAAWWVQRRGLVLGPDAWTYWTSSIALLEGRGFVDGHGLPVTAWPIGYPAWLTLVQACCGVSADAVRIADSLSIGLLAALATLWGQQRLAGGTAPSWPVAVAAVVQAAAAARGCASEYLMLVGWFGALCCLGGGQRLDAWRGIGAVLGLTVAVSARHAALAFVPAAWCLVAARLGDRKRAALVSALGALVIGCWWLGHRLALGQQGSLVWFAGRYGLPDIVWTMLRGIDRGLGVFPFGLGWFAVITSAVTWARRPAARWLGLPAERLRHGPVVAATLVALVGLVVMFLVVPIADPPRQRFVRFASMMAMLLGSVLLVQSRGPRRALLLVLLLVPPALPLLRDVLKGRTGLNTTTADGGESFVPLDAVPGPAGSAELRLPDGRLRVPTPRFRWQVAAPPPTASQPR
ncbi:MAG: hypothetical protein IT455_03710 [Planctomycetes bacterium]|nr:hypothetical protein [Planctomycetota bacterium]